MFRVCAEFPCNWLKSTSGQEACRWSSATCSLSKKSRHTDLQSQFPESQQFPQRIWSLLWEEGSQGPNLVIQNPYQAPSLRLPLPLLGKSQKLYTNEVIIQTGTTETLEHKCFLALTRIAIASEFSWLVIFSGQNLLHDSPGWVQNCSTLHHLPGRATQYEEWTKIPETRLRWAEERCGIPGYGFLTGLPGSFMTLLVNAQPLP